MGVLTVIKKEGKQKGKKGIGPRMKNGRTQFNNGAILLTRSIACLDMIIGSHNLFIW